MCELFAASLKIKTRVNKYLNELRSHSHQHPDGWGMAVFDDAGVTLTREDCPAYESRLMEDILSSEIMAKDIIGHIRLATRGELILENCHPFVREDNRGRTWTVAHNGTIFSSELLDTYKDMQVGSTDSERIILHLIHKINSLNDKSKTEVSLDERCRMMDEIVLSIARPNKLNLMVYDGEALYIHTNMRDTLFYREIDEGLIFGTAPLDEDTDSWKPLEMMRLLAFKGGQQIYSGTKHDYEYFL